MGDAAAQETLRSGEVAEFMGEQFEQIGLAVGAGVGKGPLERGPYAFIGIQFGRVGRERFQVQTRKTSRQPVHGIPLVDLGIVQQHDQMPMQVTQQLTQEGADFRAMDVDRVQMAVQPKASALGTDRDAGNGRNPVVAQDVVVDGRLTTRAPGLAHRWNQQEPGFVDEDDMGCQPRGVFFIRGQTLRFHSPISASLRSAARRSGFWWLHPN